MADIELVIKIDEEIYETLRKNYVILGWYRGGNTVISNIHSAVAKGKPLPKGHGRLIDEKEVKKMIEEAKINNEHSKTFAENIIKFAPTIIEADTESEE